MWKVTDEAKEARQGLCLSLSPFSPSFLRVEVSACCNRFSVEVLPSTTQPSVPAPARVKVNIG
jgi:hypothetical protein